MNKRDRMERVRVARAGRLNRAYNDYQAGAEIPMEHIFWLMNKYVRTAAKCPWYVDMKGEVK